MATHGRRADDGLDELATEAWNADGADLDLRSTRELVGLMNAEDARVPAAVAEAADAIAAAIDDIAARLRARRSPDLRRRRHVGAPRRARRRRVRVDVLDAAGPGRRPDRGGAPRALRSSRKRPRTTPMRAARELERLGVRADDAVVGVSASGRTPYVLGAVRAARAVGALTVGVVSVPDSELAGLVDHEIAVAVGPGDPRRLDAAQGRHGAEADPEHDLDAVDDPHRQDVRQPDGRRLRHEREAPRARAPDPPAATGEPPEAIESALRERRRRQGSVR